MQADGHRRRALPEEVNDAKQEDACLARGKPILAPEAGTTRDLKIHLHMISGYKSGIGKSEYLEL